MTDDAPRPASDPAPRLDLEYPCAWQYRVIGPDATRLRAALESVAGDEPHEIREGNSSRSGRYVSLELAITVRDEAHRLGLLAALNEHDDVKFVL